MKTAATECLFNDCLRYKSYVCQCVCVCVYVCSTLTNTSYLQAMNHGFYEHGSFSRILEYIPKSIPTIYCVCVYCMYVCVCVSRIDPQIVFFSISILLHCDMMNRNKWISVDDDDDDEIVHYTHLFHSVFNNQQTRRQQRFSIRQSSSLLSSSA